MALIVETGAGLAGANSYVSDSDYVTYADARGYEIGATEADRERELVNAALHLENYRSRFKGLKAYQEQALQWPRVQVSIDGFAINSNAIPTELKRAQMEFAYIGRTVDLAPNANYQNVSSQSLGDMSISYFEGGSYQSVQHKGADIFLSALIKHGGQLRAYRA